MHVSPSLALNSICKQNQRDQDGLLEGVPFSMGHLRTSEKNQDGTA